MENNIGQNQEKQGGENQVKKATKIKKQKRRRRIVFLFSIPAILIFVVFPLLINFYADIIVGRTLSEIVRIESNGKYELTFEDVGLNVFSREISFKGVVLQPGDSLAFPDSINRVSVQVPDFHLKGASWLRSVWKRELIIDQISVHRPKVVYNGQKDAQERLRWARRLSRHNLQSHIKSYLDLLKIESFDVEKGSVTLDFFNQDIEEKLEIHDFSIAVSNFHLDSVLHAQDDRLFFSDSMGLQLDDGRFYYQRGPVIVSFAHLDISTGKDELNIKAIKFLQKKDSLNILEFDIPGLSFRGFQVLDMVKTGNISLEEIAFSKPNFLLNLHHRQHSHPAPLDSITRKIYSTVTAHLNSVAVQKITFTQAGLLIPEGFENTGEIRLPDFDLTLKNFFIDSSSYENRRKFLFLDDMVLLSHGQTLVMKDKGLEVSYGKLSFNTGHSRMRMNDVRLKKTDSVPGEHFAMRFPEIKLVGNDFKQDLLNRSIKLKSLVLNNADVDLQINPVHAKPNIDFYNLYALIRGTLESVDVQDVRINAADVDLSIGAPAHPEIDVAGKFNIGLSGFVVDEQSDKRDEICYARDADVYAENLKMGFYKPGYTISMDKLFADTRTSAVDVSGLAVDTVPDRNQIPATIIGAESLKLSGVDFKSAYHQDGYFVESLIAVKPDITLVTHAAVPADSAARPALKYFIGQAKFHQGQFRIADVADNGNLIAVNQFDILLDSLHPNGAKPEITCLDARLHGISVPMYQSNLMAFADSLGISSVDSSVVAKEITISPIEKNDLVRSFQVRFPLVSIDGMPMLDFYHENALSANKLLFLKPEIQMVSGGQNMKPVSFHDFDPGIVKSGLLKKFSLVNIDTVTVVDMALVREVSKDSTTSTLALDGVNLSVFNFDVDEAATMTEDNLLFASDIRLAIDSITRLSDSRDMFTLTDFNLSTAEKSFSISSIQYYAKEQVQKRLDATLDFGSVSSGGIDYFELIVGKRVSLDVLEIDRPDLIFNRHKSENAGFASGSQPLNLYEMISGHIHELRARDIRLNDIKLLITENDRPHKGSYLFEQIDFRLKHMLIDSSNRIFDNRFLYAEGMDFTIHNFRETSADSLYDFGASSIRFSSNNAILKIDSGYLQPNFSDSVFTARVGVQTDRLQFVFDSLKLSQFRMSEFIRKRNFIVGKAEVDGLTGNDYRSKFYPYPQNHYPKLPVSALKSVDVLFCIDTVQIRNSHFKYREYLPPALQPGEIWFSDINIQGRNITNDTAMIRQNQFMRFNASARLMGAGGLGLNLEFDLADDNDFYKANGILNNFNMTELNPVLEHIAFVKVTNGRNHMLEFNYEADNDVARGQMLFEYKKLHIRLIDKKTLRMKGLGESIASFIANTFVVRRNNPKYLVFKRKGDIYFSRDKQKSFFNYLTKSTLSGVNSTIRGVNEERKEKRRKREMERQVRKEGRLNEKYMKELNSEKRSISQPVE